MLSQTVKAGNPQLSQDDTIDTPKLSNLGITRNDPSCWHSIASIPKEEFSLTVNTLAHYHAAVSG